MATSTTEHDVSLAFAPPQIGSDPQLAALASRLLWVGCADDAQLDSFFQHAVTEIAETWGADYVAVVAALRGELTPLEAAGGEQPVPRELLTEVLDTDRPQSSPPWFAAPLGQQFGAQHVLVIRSEVDDRASQALERASLLAGIIAQSAAAIRLRQSQRRKSNRLAALLEVAAGWNRARDVETLLGDMAQAATQLLDADRASIFLWDKQRKRLVARPALGLPNGELSVPDDAGVVGHVLREGEPLRVGTDEHNEQINRAVDQQSGYVTDTLICVPLHGPKGAPLGVFEVLNKRDGEFDADDEAALVELAAHAATALENTQERVRLIESRRQLSDEAAGQVQLIGDSPAVEALRSTIRRVAATDLAVLIQGENGTGKEVASRMIHYLSDRRDQPFIAVNCAAISETLIESELFGHEKGAFTDARETRAGKFELAAGGTLFLDEIGDLSLAGQAKLLRVLEEKVIVRVGGSQEISTDVRVIAATNQNLPQMVRENRFREDLYYRLNVVTLEMPPLRDRAEDIVSLAEFFVADFCRRARRTPLVFSADARQALLRHDWPGNVRELRNLIERLCYLLPDDQIEAEDLRVILSPRGEEASPAESQWPLATATDQFQADHIRRAIDRARGNMSEAAKRLGLHRSNLYRKMRQLGMESSRR